MPTIRPVVLREELMVSFREIERQIEECSRHALQLGVEPHQLRSVDGTWMLAPLIIAKVQILHALVLINPKETRG